MVLRYLDYLHTYINLLLVFVLFFRQDFTEYLWFARNKEIHHLCLLSTMIKSMCHHVQQFFFFFFFRENFHVTQTGLELTVHEKKPLNFWCYCFTFWMLKWQMCATVPGSCGTGDGSQASVHTDQALNQFSYIPSSFSLFDEIILFWVFASYRNQQSMHLT